MVIETVRGYAQLANGLGDVTRQRASQVARQIVEQGGVVVTGVASSAGSADVAKQVQGLAEDLLATARTNRDLLIGLIRTEVERTVNRMGLVGADELNAMARVVERLQNQLDAAIAFGGRATTRQPRGQGAGRCGLRSPSPGQACSGDIRSGSVSGTVEGRRQEGHGKKATAKKTAKKSATKKAAKKAPRRKKIAAKKTASAAASRARRSHRRRALRHAPRHHRRARTRTGQRALQPTMATRRDDERPRRAVGLGRGVRRSRRGSRTR